MRPKNKFWTTLDAVIMSSGIAACAVAVVTACQLAYSFANFATKKDLKEELKTQLEARVKPVNDTLAQITAKLGIAAPTSRRRGWV